MSKVAIIGTRYPDLAIEEDVLAGAEIVSGPGASPDEILALAGDADVIVAGTIPKFTADVLASLSCRAIVRSGVGVDTVDLEAAHHLGYTIAYIPDYGTEAVAQHTLALALAGTRRLVESDRIVRTGRWGLAELRPLHLPSAMTAGVVGFGRIGRRVAELLVAVGFRRVLAHDAFAEPRSPDVEAVSLATLLSESDLVTLHVPGPQDGSALMGAAEIGRMRAESVLVNTARGSLIDASALAAGLSVGAPRIAALDVFDPEPPTLSAFDGVIDHMILSPHTAWYTEQSQIELRRKSAEEARRILAGEPPLNSISYQEAP